ncbi:MAG: diguanylate cyclase [Thermodesulfobacteriaceae bacterium]|nr:diguanylate cyclase [Thermodesulfobacteriaceae bacterium]MDW8136302.1 diguanylate cyclase [Thermodesulfobacterium sp.]
MIFFQGISTKESFLKSRKEMLINLGEIALALTEYYYLLSKKGKISEKEAQEEVKAILRKIRYEETGYFWINDGTLPYPKMIMHPIMPELEGKICDKEEFFSAFMAQAGLQQKPFKVKPNKNLLTLGVELANQSGRSFIWYKWNKPLPKGYTKEHYDKMSYMVKFEPWGWYIGTGIYIDDVEEAFLKLIKENFLVFLLVSFLIFLIIAGVNFYFWKSIRYSIDLANTDYLTEISNRKYFLEVLDREIRRTLRTLKPFSVVMFDIDRFKNINDQLGHKAGDEVLKKVVKVVKERIRKTDLLARWGGEEFVILLPETELNGAKNLAEHLRKKIKEIEIPKIGNITASFGVTSFKVGDNEDTLMQRADFMMYKAKEAGRDCVQSG